MFLYRTSGTFFYFSELKLTEWSTNAISSMKQQELINFLSFAKFFRFFSTGLWRIFRLLLKFIIFRGFHFQMQHLRATKAHLRHLIQPKSSLLVCRCRFRPKIEILYAFTNAKDSAGSFFSRKVNFWSVACISTVFATNSTQALLPLLQALRLCEFRSSCTASREATNFDPVVFFNRTVFEKRKF